jgi:hypothetical protein
MITITAEEMHRLRCTGAGPKHGIGYGDYATHMIDIGPDGVLLYCADCLPGHLVLAAEPIDAHSVFALHDGEDEEPRLTTLAGFIAANTDPDFGECLFTADTLTALHGLQVGEAYADGGPGGGEWKIERLT